MRLGGYSDSESLRILGIILDYKLTFDTHVSDSMSQEAESLDIVHHVEKLFDCPPVLKSCVNACVLPKLEYCASV